MKRVKKFFKSNIKLVVGIIIGTVIAGGSVAVVYALAASSVTYSNSGISANNVQDAIDEIYTLAASGTGLDLRNSENFIEAYTYNASTCVTGNEDTCVATTCYKTKNANACPAGTIIRYKVKPGHVETFHVMYDDASTITMQSQRNTVYNTAWDSSGSNASGPQTILPALESATAGWVNVNDQTYTMGTTTFKTNAYTGCSEYNTCDANKYTLASRTAKARMITLQEAVALGCTGTAQSCPKWMYNYLKTSTSNGGTENDTSHGPNNTNNVGYWTMSARSSNAHDAWLVGQRGRVYSGSVSSAPGRGARAVVVVSK